VADADPFDLVGDGDVGVVCVHGFTGTPFEVRYLGEQLARAGFQVHGPRLPGHGTRVSDLDATRWQDWADAVEDAFDTMRMLCKRVVVVGQSLGGLLALHLASRRPDVVAVASLAAPLWLDGLAGRVARLAEQGAFDNLRAPSGRAARSGRAGPFDNLRAPSGSAARSGRAGPFENPRAPSGRAARSGRAGPFERIRPYLAAVPKFSGSDVRDRQVRAANPCYDRIPLRALGELARYMRVVDAALPEVRQPVLVMHAQHDHTAPVSCAYHIARRTRAERLRILPRSYHLIAVDVERDIVAADVVDFVRRATRPISDQPGDLACAT
jgi:esterase/lipase